MLSHQLGKLGRDGQRVLRLSWQVQRHLWGFPGCPPPFHPPSHPLFLPASPHGAKGCHLQAERQHAGVWLCRVR